MNCLNVTCDNRIGLHPYRRLNACYVKVLDRPLETGEKLIFQQSYNDPEKIKTLDILTEADKPSIDHIPIEAFDAFPNLETLRINSHVTTIAQQDLETAKNLTELVLSNQIKSITRGLFPAENRLTFLSFESNQISTIDDYAFEHLQHLFSLKLQQNKLEEIKQHTFTGMIALHVLNLNRNRIRNIHDGAFESLNDLQFLHLQENEMETLTEGLFRGLKNLTDISISHNRIHHIYNSLQHLTNIKKIDLNYNQIVDLNLNEFAKLPSLIDLRLISSGFSFPQSNVIDAPLSTSPLEYLYLDSNNLSKAIDLRQLHIFGELKELSLDYNLFEDFNFGDNKHLINILPKLKFISLEGTKIDENNLNQIAIELKANSVTLH